MLAICQDVRRNLDLNFLLLFYDTMLYLIPTFVPDSTTRSDILAITVLVRLGGD